MLGQESPTLRDRLMAAIKAGVCEYELLLSHSLALVPSAFCRRRLWDLTIGLPILQNCKK